MVEFSPGFYSAISNLKLNNYEKPKMKIATTPEEKNLIYRLRYEVDIEELDEPLISVNHEYRQIKDEFDNSAMHIGSYLNNKAVGACRLNLIENGYSDELNVFELDRFENVNDGGYVVASKLLIAKNFRSTGLFSTLMHYMYALSLMQECKVGLACLPHSLVSVFSKYGFISYKGSCLHPEMGHVVPMYLDLQNFKLMKDIDSPFLSTYEVFKKNSEIAFVM